MLRSLFGIDWRKSNAHVLLLSKFLSPRQADDFALSESWKAALKEWLSPDFETNLVLDRDAATRMVLFHAIHRVEVANYKDSGVVKQVEILAASDSCEACKKIAGKRFKLNDVIELPYEHCTNEIGCRCTLITVLK